MKIGEHGVMNNDFHETYDQEDDVYYVSFKTGEPSYCEEIDDILIVEVGIFTNLPTGFRLLNFSKYNIHEIKLPKNTEFKDLTVRKTVKKRVMTAAGRKSALKAAALKSVRALASRERPTFHQRERATKTALDKVLA